MSFVRRLFGGDRREQRDGPGGRGRSEPAGEPDVPSARRRYLEYIGGSSAKFYAAVLYPNPDDAWSVAFNFGRIGFPRAWAHKVEGVSFAGARRAYDALLAEKAEKDYQARPWPAGLSMPEGAEASVDLEAGEPEPARSGGIFVSDVVGRLLSASGGVVAGVFLPAGRLFQAGDEGGPRGSGPLLWISEAPMDGVSRAWSTLATAFPATGLWPVIVDGERGIDDFDDRLLDMERSRATGAAVILRRWWRDNLGLEDEFDESTYSPLGPEFPGLASPTPGDRPTSIDHLVAGLTGHLGLVAARRPGDVLDSIAWEGAANYDANPSDLSTVMRSWEDRFDAYLVGLGFDTITLVVARPPRDRTAATAIAAEHLAFCPDNIWQGVGTISEYAKLLVNAPRWDFWWD